MAAAAEQHEYVVQLKFCREELLSSDGAMGGEYSDTCTMGKMSGGELSVALSASIESEVGGLLANVSVKAGMEVKSSFQMSFSESREVTKKLTGEKGCAFYVYQSTITATTNLGRTLKFGGAVQGFGKEQSLMETFEVKPPKVANPPKAAADGPRQAKLYNVKWGGPLFCGDGSDRGGDHWAWVASKRNYQANGKEIWTITKQQDGTFKLFNGKWKGPLFCGDSADGSGDRWAWVENNPNYENGGKERWRLEKQADQTYKLFNGKWKGPLFCGDGTDGGGDHWAWVEPNPGYENNGKERWHIEWLN